MSKGAGAIERKVAELFRASTRDYGGNCPGEDRTYTVDELAGAVFGVAVAEATELFPAIRPTRAQRVSVVRAARSVLARAQRFRDQKNKLQGEARAAADAKLGPEKPRDSYERFQERVALWEAHPSYLAADKIPKSATDLALWQASVMPDRTLVFHHFSRPVRVWAVEISAGGVVWDEAEIVEITADRISVRYQGARFPLRRPLSPHGSWWRGVRFMDTREGWQAERLEGKWREQYGHLHPVRMELSVARAMLGLGEHYTREDILAAFRKAALRCHPDQGGTVEQFRALVEARDRLLAAIGTSAPAPKMPTFTPKGRKTYYTTAAAVARRSAARIGAGRGRLAAG